MFLASVPRMSYAQNNNIGANRLYQSSTPDFGPPTLSIVGTQGVLPQSYALVCHDSNGNISSPNSRTINNIPGVLSGGNYVHITWTNKCTSVDVLKGTNQALALGVTTGSTNDTGQATTAYNPIYPPQTGAINFQGPTNLIGPFATFPVSKTLAATDVIDLSGGFIQAATWLPILL